MLGNLNDQQIDALLHHEVTGRLGCHSNGKTYVVPISYTYDGTSIIGHSREGLKIQMMRANPEVCFETDHMYTLSNWQSAIVWGRYEELKGHEAEEAMRKLINRMEPLMVGETSHPHPDIEDKTGVIRAVIFRILITEKTGRFEKR
jgi:nitroimidazol reductase NimA-like FMN-containing flavoprotein (pyridoxamine 5'-phosphate oxidase superfamily)